MAENKSLVFCGEITYKNDGSYIEILRYGYVESLYRNSRSLFTTPKYVFISVY